MTTYQKFINWAKDNGAIFDDLSLHKYDNGERGIHSKKGTRKGGAGGFGKTNPSIGSMSRLLRIKQDRSARKNYLPTSFSRNSGNSITGGGSFKSKNSFSLLTFY